MDRSAGASEGQARWLGVAAWAVTALAAAGVGSMLLRGRSVDVLYARWMLHNAPVAVGCAWLGTMVLRRRPGHRSGTLLLLLGAASGLHVASVSLADARLVAAGIAERGSEFVPFAPADLPLDAAVPMWAASWLWLVACIPALTLLLLIFPDGELPSRRWRVAVALGSAATAVMVAAYAVESWPGSDRVIQMRGQVEVHPTAVVLLGIGGALVVLGASASIASLVVRWRAADPELRTRIRPLLLAGVAMVLVLVATFPWQELWVPAGMVSLWIFLITYAVSVSRYRLHDLDVVVDRAVVATLLAAGATGLYLAVVVAAGSVAGRTQDSTVVPLLAAAVVAVAFEPARRRTRRLVDRLLYGRDRDAAEVLAELADRLPRTSPDVLLGEVVGLLVRSTGASGAEIVIDSPGDASLTSVAGASGGDDGAGAVLVEVPVRHDGEVLGRLRLRGRARSDLVVDAERLVEGVAGTLGVVLHNAVLTAELEAQVEQLRGSRLRLVRAQDEARRALERDIHDGAQARLISLRIRLGLATSLAAASDEPRLAGLLEELGLELDEAVRALRALGHGLHPPVLEGAGIAAALRAEARSLPLAVTVRDGGVGRYQPEVEAAVYFSCLEAIQNAAKHGAGREVVVDLGHEGSTLCFSVSDDGVGFDPGATRDGAGLTNLRDRIGSLGGDVVVRSGPSAGTVVRGRVPAEPRSPTAAQPVAAER